MVPSLACTKLHYCLHKNSLLLAQNFLSPGTFWVLNSESVILETLHSTESAKHGDSTLSTRLDRLQSFASHLNLITSQVLPSLQLSPSCPSLYHGKLCERNGGRDGGRDGNSPISVEDYTSSRCCHFHCAYHCFTWSGQRCSACLSGRAARFRTSHFVSRMLW